MQQLSDFQGAVLDDIDTSFFFTVLRQVCVHMFYTGSVEDRRYLKHDILNEDVEFNVIVTT